MPEGVLSRSADSSRGYRRIVLLLFWLVIVPTAVLLAVGILMMVFWRAQLNILFGILVVTLVGCLVTGAVLIMVFVRREAKLSKLQVDFVSKVSHELRTPLTSIQMFGEMLRAETDPERSRVCLDVLERETARLSERIERLLDWGRMESGRRVYELTANWIDEVIDESLAAFEPTTFGKEVDLSVAIEPDLPPLLLDRSAMVDALNNLLSNALKYSGDAPVIAIGCRRERDSVRITVADNGIGIPRHEHARIFQRFYRVDQLLTSSIEGSGLGLAIVRHIVRGHRGRIQVESVPGTGSTFSILLPIPDLRGAPPRRQRSST